MITTDFDDSIDVIHVFWRLFKCFYCIKNACRYLKYNKKKYFHYIDTMRCFEIFWQCKIVIYLLFVYIYCTFVNKYFILTITTNFYIFFFLQIFQKFFKILSSCKWYKFKKSLKPNFPQIHVVQFLFSW